MFKITISKKKKKQPQNFQNTFNGGETHGWQLVISTIENCTRACITIGYSLFIFTNTYHVPIDYLQCSIFLKLELSDNKDSRIRRTNSNSYLNLYDKII